jgi:hypothetical protein
MMIHPGCGSYKDKGKGVAFSKPEPVIPVAVQMLSQPAKNQHTNSQQDNNVGSRQECKWPMHAHLPFYTVCSPTRDSTMAGDTGGGTISNRRRGTSVIFCTGPLHKLLSQPNPLTNDFASPSMP